MLSAVHATPIRPSVRVRLSVTRVLCIKTAEHIIEILSRSDRPIVVFRHQGSLRKSDGFTPQRRRRIQGEGGSDFRPKMRLYLGNGKG